VTPLFDGELALVTGARRGIGRAIALEPAAAGVTPEQSTRSLMEHLASDATGEIWNVKQRLSCVRDETPDQTPAITTRPASLAGASHRVRRLLEPAKKVPIDQDMQAYRLKE